MEDNFDADRTDWEEAFSESGNLDWSWIDNHLYAKGKFVRFNVTELK